MKVFAYITWTFIFFGWLSVNAWVLEALFGVERFHGFVYALTWHVGMSSATRWITPPNIVKRVL